MFGNDPQCRAPNSGRRKVWSIEGIKQPLQPHQKHDSHPILADYGTDQFSIRINDKGNDIIVKPLQSFSFKSVTPFQTKFKTPTKKNNKTLHQQSLLLNDTDVTSDDEDHIYTRIPKSDSSFSQDTTLQTENYSTLKQPSHNTSQKSISAINVQPNLPSLTHCQQIIPFYDTSFFKYKNYFQGFFLPDDYSLDIKTLQQQQSQDPVLRTVYSWLLNNEKPEFITPLITSTPFLHVYYKRFSQLFIDESTCNGCLIPSIDQTLRRPEFGARHCGSLPNTACFLD